MKKIIFSICLVACQILVFAQNPMDERLYDEVKLKIGDDATELHACDGSRKKDKSSAGSCSMTLTKDVLYRFTVGNSKRSASVLKQKLTFTNSKKLIKSIEVKAGEISAYEFLCKETGKYSLTSFFEDSGYSYEVTIISKVNK